MNFQRFYVLLDNKLSIIRLYLFFACFLLKSKDDQNEQQLFQNLPYYQERKVQKVEGSISKKKYRATRKLDMEKNSHFFYFRIWIWCSVRQKMKWKTGECKDLCEEERTVQQDSILHDDNSAFHPFLSYNTVKNVIISLFRTPVLYSVLVRLLMKT